MLGYLLQSLFRQAAPLVSQTVRRIPPAVITNSVRIASRELSRWYNSLSADEKKRVDNVIFWVIKDVVGDVVQITTGLPLKPLVSKAFNLLKEYSGNSEAEKYVESEIKAQLESRSIKTY